MTFSTSSDTIRRLCDTLTGKALTDAFTKFREESNDHFMSEKVKTMNGRILTNHVDHLDNFKKHQENKLVSSENIKNSGKNETVRLSTENNNEKLRTIQEVQGTTTNNSSGDEDVSSLTSDTDSDSDGSLSDSSEEEVEFFPIKKSDKNNNINEETVKEDSPKFETNTEPSMSQAISSSPNKDAKNSHDVTVNADCGTAVNGDTIMQTPNKLPRRLSPMGTGSLKNGQKQNEKDQTDGSLMSNSGSQLIPMTSSSYDAQTTSGNSDVVIPSAHNPPDLIRGNLNGSGTVSDDSDLKDHARILAELQKIVQDDEAHDSEHSDGHQSKDVGADGEGGKTESITKDSSQISNDGGSGQMDNRTGDHGTANGVHKAGGAGDHSNSFLNSNKHHDGKSTINGHLDSGKMDTSSNLDGTNKKSYHGNDHQNKFGHDDTVNGHKDDADDTNHHGNSSGDSGSLHGNVRNKGAKSKNNQEKSVGAQLDSCVAGKNDTKLEQPTKMKSQVISENPSASTPTNFANQEHSLENLERKLSNLQISNSEQTTEIRRLNTLNQTLKAKFEKLEQTSSRHQNIEEKMLQRNEELEKHLLGMLKSQEIIFDMKENLKTASADKEKLTKDYKEAVKALEAVDKLFGQKDALVKKWKEATEESRQLVELLKKHNAEVGDIETVDKLKEDIAQLKEKVSKAEERNRTTGLKNEELIEQSRAWKEKYERENEQAIKLSFELQEVTKELKNHQKLAGKRGRKNQMLQLEITELKDTLKLAKERLVENERRLKELERKHADTQEMYTKIIHEKEKQHSVLIKNSESYQKDLVSNIENVENARKEADVLKESIVALERDKIEIAEKLKNNEKSLEETLNKKMELSEQLAKLQSDFEASKIEAVDNELFTEEQTVRLEELEEQCKQLQHVLKQYIHSNGRTRNRRPSTAPNRYGYGKKSRPSQTWPSQLDMYRQLLAPPRGAPRRRKSSAKREARYRVQITDKNNDSEDTLDDVTQKFDESSKRISFHPNRPKSTYGNRSLSTNNNEDRHHDAEHGGKGWIPKIVLVDNQKLESSSEHDSGSVSADQYAMQYVKLGDRVLFELAVDGKKQNIPGTVKYVGPVYHSNFNSGIYAGLKLDIPAGDTNGTVGERMYFRCLKNHGKFVKLSHILAVQNPRTQQYTRVLPMAYK